MLSGHYNDSFSIISFFVKRKTNDKALYHSFRNSFADLDFLAKLFVTNFVIINKFNELGVPIRKWVGDPKFILLEASWNFEWESIIHSRGILTLKFSFFISHFFSSSFPTFFKRLNIHMFLFNRLGGLMYVISILRKRKYGRS